jgi:N-acyl amino acid synthase of PEP-CTERM/exosortase system
MQSVFELRYQVYCLERGYLPGADYPGGMETDAFDPGSAHFCEFDDCGDIAGYVRLVRDTGDTRFPFQQHCSDLLDGVSLPPATISAEVSRLIIRSDFRRQRVASVAEGASVVRPTIDHRPRRPERRHPCSPLILPQLYRQMVVYSLATGIRYWYAAMERPLARSLLHMNYPFRQITPEVDYYGPVATYMLDMDELKHRLALRNPDHLAWLTNADALAVPGTMPPQVSTPAVRELPPLHAPAVVLHRETQKQAELA